jgi:hypothetical protein
METIKVIVECGKDGKYSAYMDCYDYDFGLSGFGNTAKEAINDFYSCVEEEKAMCKKEGKIRGRKIKWRQKDNVEDSFTAALSLECL